MPVGKIRILDGLVSSHPETKSISLITLMLARPQAGLTRALPLEAVGDRAELRQSILPSVQPSLLGGLVVAFALRRNQAQQGQFFANLFQGTLTEVFVTLTIIMIIKCFVNTFPKTYLNGSTC
jgi:hypothetical protein